MLLEPKVVEFDLPNGSKKSLTISKFPAVAGRKIISMYIASGIPKLGDYKVNQEIMLELMSYVAITHDNGTQINLITEALVNSHIPDWETLIKIEKAMMEYNCSFFQNGGISNFFGDFAKNLPMWISKILTDSLEQLLLKINTPSQS